MITVNFRRTALFPILLLSIVSDHASGIDRLTEFAESCGIKAVRTSARVFSDNDRNRWEEYSTAKKVPENAEWSETAYVWSKLGFIAFIDVEGIGEDFTDSSYYCFDSAGNLSSLDHEFRTAWGWGFAESSKVDSDGRETTKSHFFSMKDRKEIPRPQGANDVQRGNDSKSIQKTARCAFFFVVGNRHKSQIASRHY